MTLLTMALEKRAAALLNLTCLFVVGALLCTAGPAAAGEGSSDDNIASAELELGGKWADFDGDRSFIFPYDPLDSGVVGSFDLFYIGPALGTFNLESEFLDGDDWDLRGDYNYGANVHVGARARKFYHALENRSLPGDFETPAPGFGTVRVESGTANPDAENFNTLTDYTAYVKARIPSYPAHVRADARHYTREGSADMVYFFRGCSTHICHVNSRTRELDQVTQEYNLGFDTHLGPVDIVYNFNNLHFQDDAEDPVDYYGSFSIGPRPPGEYTHHINPDTSSYTNTIRINSNLTNRMVLALDYRFGKSRNDDSTITDGRQHFTGDLSYQLNGRHFLSFRFLYDDDYTDDIPEEYRALRTAIGNAVEPGRRERMSELTYRWTPGRSFQLHAHARYVNYDREDTAESGLPPETTMGTVDLDGRWNILSSLKLEAEIARDWQEDPPYATDFTDRWRYMLGAVWGPSPLLSFQAIWRGYRGTNDNGDSLTRAYYGLTEAPEDFERSTKGDAVNAVALWVPAEPWRFVLSYAYTVNGVDQDMLLGTAIYPDRVYRVDDSPWDADTQVANLEISWAATKQLGLTLGGLFVTGAETFEPEFALSEGISGSAESEFTKLMGSLEIVYALTASFDLNLSGYWADYNDEQDDGRDGRGGGVVASISRKW